MIELFLSSDEQMDGA